MDCILLLIPGICIGGFVGPCRERAWICHTRLGWDIGKRPVGCSKHVREKIICTASAASVKDDMNTCQAMHKTDRYAVQTLSADGGGGRLVCGAQPQREGARQRGVELHGAERPTAGLYVAHSHSEKERDSAESSCMEETGAGRAKK